MDIRVKVTPGARKEKVVVIDDTTFHISVKEEAKGNKANVRVREIVAGLCGVSVGKTRIRTGHTSGSKIIHLG